MSHFTSPQRGFRSRLFVGLLFFGALLFFTFFFSSVLTAQQEAKGQKKQKPVEEVVDKGPKPKRKAIPVDDDDEPKKPAAVEPLAGDIAAYLKYPDAGVRALAGDLAHPHDIVKAEYSSGTRDNKAVEPIVKFYGHPPKIKRDLPVIPLSQEWEAGKQQTLASTVIKDIIPYEELAQQLVDKFLTEESGKLSRRDALAIAYRVLSKVGEWHRSARSKDTRQGDDWESVQVGLEKKLLDIREKQLDEYLAAGDWRLASSLARTIGRAYQDDRNVQERVAKKLAEYIVAEASKGGLDAEKLKDVRDRLKEIEAHFPGSSATEAISTDLKKQAQSLYNRGLEFIKANRNQEGLELLQIALDLYPLLPGLRNDFLKESNRYPILRVGVRNFPIFMAPGLACTESEREAVEMIFEGLIRQVPAYPGKDDVAETFKPELARRMPILGDQLLYRFTLSPETYWAKDLDHPRKLTNQDLYSTCLFLKNQNGPGYAPAWDELVQSVLPGNNDRQVNVTFKHGFIDPWSAMTFKVLPDEAGKNYKDGFARKPFGSGPYMLGTSQTIEGQQRLTFMANPLYGLRPGKQHLPRVREIHFAQTQDPLTEFEKGKLDVLLPDVVRDLGPAKVQAALGKRLIGPLPSRRVYFLAVNLRKSVFALDSAEVRQALAYAIPRGEILKTVYGGLDGDKPLTGPYPAGSWACPEKEKSLDNPTLAKQLLGQGGAKAKLDRAGKLTLKYPNDDKAAAKAMEIIQKQLGETLGVRIDLEAVDPHDLREQVEQSHAYDLAYYHYDFPSEAYWLWPLFHPSGGYMGGLPSEASFLSGAFRRAMTRRDPRDLREAMHNIHNEVRAKMYILPLWQLGSYYAIRDGIVTPSVDPLRVLADVDHWQPRLAGR